MHKTVLHIVFPVIVALVALQGLAADVPQAPGAVEFGDPQLYQAVVDTLGIQSGVPVFPDDMADLESLRARSAGITSLAGLETAVNLRELDLRDNAVRDLAPLAELVQLEWLSLRENPGLQSLTPIAGLTGLTYLNINRNEEIQSIRPLADMTGLTVLIMRNVPVLADAGEREVLSGLTRLKRLNVRNTGLPSVELLLPGLEAGLYREQLDLRENPLDDTELLEPYLEDIEDYAAGIPSRNLDRYQEYLALFDPQQLHRFTLRVDRAEWDAMNSHLVEYTDDVDGRGRSGRYWRADELIYEGSNGRVVVEDAGFRTRGNTTRTIPENPPGSGEYHRAHFNIAVNRPLDLEPGTEEYQQRRDRRLFNLRRIGFKYGVADHENSDGVIREVYAQNLLNDAGVMTSRAGLAAIGFEILEPDGSVTELDYGMYMSFEPINKNFLNRRWGTAFNDGDLYKNLWQGGGPATLAPDANLERDGSRLIGVKDWERNYRPSYDQKNNDGPDDVRTHENLRGFIAELDAREGDALRRYLDREFAIERYLSYMAANLLLGNPDDYRGNFNNYYMYFPMENTPTDPPQGVDGGLDRIEFMPYDYDHGLGGGWEGYYDTAAVGIFSVPAAELHGRTLPRPLVDKVLAIPEYRQQYVDRLEDLLDSGLFAYEGYADFHRDVARLAEEEDIRVFGRWNTQPMQPEPSAAVRSYFEKRIRGVRRDIDVFRYSN
ncbi:CotH kinase family protein [Spirochaeta africana]|uniref:CotH protein n=1 Tax=Spirochaeta africana (strain ATCC 700263 / DSM 8902 / Z-7692) TaxID=889378 RepID=H9UF90_SPIAZ|nr:CotH kinase family protein [Spirochaeta africana]AFG36183.1 CotH protein [Spirochaeta africana DSM 8902]